MTFIIITLLINTPTYAHQFKKNVIIFSSYHHGYEWNDNMEDGIVSVLKNQNINIKMEYLDSLNINISDYYDKLFEMYKSKYKNNNFDLIICSDNAAYNFFLDNKEKLFPNTPLVFTGLNNFKSYESNSKLIKNSTGVLDDIDIEGNVNLILSLHPNTKNIFITIDRTIIGNDVYQQILDLKNNNIYKVNLNVIDNLPLEDIVTIINENPKENIILYASTLISTKHGHTLYPAEAIAKIKNKTSVPIYGVWDILLDKGIIGGKITSSYSQGVKAGNLALKILTGEKIENIPIDRNIDSKYIFDYNELNKFKINLNFLPLHHSFVNEPTSVYYISKKNWTLVLCSALFIFSTIIILLFINIQKRIKNEDKLKRLSTFKEVMIEVNQAIIRIGNIDELFNLILKKSTDIMKGAEYGSVLLLNEDNHFKVAATIGYDITKMKTFNLPLKKSFHYLKTNGNIKNTIIIDNIRDLYYEAYVDCAKDWTIVSSISTPIIINNKLFGMLNIDSDKLDTFNEDDIYIMNYMKNQIENAIHTHNLYNEVMYLSKYDKLTNIYNRGSFEEVFDKVLNDSLKFNNPFFLVLFDLNDLKLINDHYGHLEGDKYISNFTDNLKANLSDCSILARYGGDEFVGVFFDTTPLELSAKFEKLNEYFANNPIIINNNRINYSFSYGIASFPSEAQNYRQLIKIADEKMYKYKENFKKKVYEPTYNLTH